MDLGVVNIASDSEGKWYSGSTVKSVRHRHRRLRRKLQKKQTRAAKRRLKRLAGKEARFARHTNHVISKEIVACAKGTRRGIKLEELGGIRRPDDGWAQATSSSPQLGVFPVANVYRVQSSTRRCSGGLCGPQEHQPGMCRMRTRRQRKPAQSSDIPLRGVPARRQCGYQRCPGNSGQGGT